MTLVMGPVPPGTTSQDAALSVALRDSALAGRAGVESRSVCRSLGDPKYRQRAAGRHPARPLRREATQGDAQGVLHEAAPPRDWLQWRGLLTTR